MKMRTLNLLLLALIIFRVNADRRKELQVKKDIKYTPYNAEQSVIFNALIEIIGETTEDTTDNWLKIGDPCDPDLHRDRLSNEYPLEHFRDKNNTDNLCSIFEDMACDTVEKICKCWTAGGIGRMEWSPNHENNRKPPGRCVMTARQRCGTLDLPPGLYPHVDFPLLRKFSCDRNEDFQCRTDLDGVNRCTDQSRQNEDYHGEKDKSKAPNFISPSCQFYITISIFVWVSCY